MVTRLTNAREAMKTIDEIRRHSSALYEKLARLEGRNGDYVLAVINRKGITTQNREEYGLGTLGIYNGVYEYATNNRPYFEIGMALTNPVSVIKITPPGKWEMIPSGIDLGMSYTELLRTHADVDVPWYCEFSFLISFPLCIGREHVESRLKESTKNKVDLKVYEDFINNLKTRIKAYH